MYEYLMQVCDRFQSIYLGTYLPVNIDSLVGFDEGYRLYKELHTEGTGISFKSYINYVITFPTDIVTIDRSFFRGLFDNEDFPWPGEHMFIRKFSFDARDDILDKIHTYWIDISMSTLCK